MPHLITVSEIEVEEEFFHSARGNHSSASSTYSASATVPWIIIISNSPQGDGKILLLSKIYFMFGNRKFFYIYYSIHSGYDC
jgi:hypothetical protein